MGDHHHRLQLPVARPAHVTVDQLLVNSPVAGRAPRQSPPSTVCHATIYRLRVRCRRQLPSLQPWNMEHHRQPLTITYPSVLVATKHVCTNGARRLLGPSASSMPVPIMSYKQPFLLAVNVRQNRSSLDLCSQPITSPCPPSARIHSFYENTGLADDSAATASAPQLSALSNIDGSHATLAANGARLCVRPMTV
jgi:hypothetical protein